MMVYKTIYQITNIEDPFRSIKLRHTHELLSIYSTLQRKIKRSKDPLYTALKLAGLSNAIDFGANPNFDLQKELKTMYSKDFDFCEYAEFKKTLHRAHHILYIADNAGETVFDRLLIEQLKKRTTYAVRSRPIINDATEEDAINAGIDKVATIISSGCDAPGTILKLCSKEFRNIYRNADMVISKGQGNYETLSTQRRPIFFLLKVKCPVIARDIGIQDGSLVLIKR
jgi:hypothetical protein